MPEPRRSDDAAAAAASMPGSASADRPPAAHPLDPARLPRMARIAAIRVDNYRTRTFVLDSALAASPGQFGMLWLPGLDEKPFSLLACDPFTRALHGLRVGDPVWVRGPFGQGFTLSGTDHLMVGGGYGVAPLLFLARQALARGDRVRMVVGARTAGDLLLIDAFHAAGAELHVATEDGSVGTRGRVTERAAPLLAARRPDGVYACGPHGMLAALEGLCHANGLAAQLAWEAYMRCGIGICGSCEHRGRLLCADGPVLSS
jgi:dihydroorotate dehydrogenase electron transfer subunit